MTPSAASVASRLTKARQTSGGWIACCPAHEDGTPSLSISDGEKGVVFHCHAGCSQEAVLNAIEALGVAIRKPKTNGNGAHHEDILTIETLAAAKRLDWKLLHDELYEAEERGVAFTYTDLSGEVTGTKYRKYLGGGATRGFSWKIGSKPCLYGLSRLERDYANDGRVILCEGETDAFTLWQHGYTALALPGASMWKDEWAALFPGSGKVYVILEPDQGGRTVEASIDKSPLCKRAHYIRFTEECKDPNVLHCQDPGKFVENFDKLIANAEPADEFTGLTGINLKDMQPHLNGFYIVKGLIPAQSEAWVIGSSGCGKTFFCTDLALHIAHNKSFRGKRVKGGLVVYVGAENPKSVERRFFAAATHNGFGAIAPLKLTGGPLDLRDLESLEKLVEFVRAAEVEHGQKCVCVFIDTLARAGGGKEDAEDFSAAIKGVDYLRDTLAITIVMIHHLGKDTERGGRGHSSMLGGMDSEITCSEQDDSKIATITKNRDGEEGERMVFKLRQVDLGIDQDGDQVKTCVVDHFDAEAAPLKRPNGKAQTQLLAELERLSLDGGVGVWTEGELREIARGLGQHKASARSAVLGLRQLGYFVPTVGGAKLQFVPSKIGKG